MHQLLDGQLSTEKSMREVLQAIFEQASRGYGVLRVSCPEKNLAGLIGLVQGRYVIGAQVAYSDQTGYQAVQRLLAITEGSFTFLETGSRPAPGTDQSLNLGVRKLIESLPNLPENAGDLFDEQSYLDDIFGPGELPDQTTGDQRKRL